MTSQTTSASAGQSRARTQALPAIGSRVRVQLGPRIVEAIVIEHRSNGRVRVRFAFDDADEAGTSSYLPSELHASA